MDTSGRKTAADYPQELLDLFHEYQHGDIDRREFFERAKRFAIGGLTVAAIFETLKPNYAWAQQVPKLRWRERQAPRHCPAPWQPGWRCAGAPGESGAGASARGWHRRGC